MGHNHIGKIKGVILGAMIFALLATAQTQISASTWSPVPFTIHVSGRVNGVDFSVGGPGIVDPLGTYSANLTFSNMPPNFHPVFMTAYTVSICCYLYAREANGGMNLHTLLGDNATYSVIRNLAFPSTGDSLMINGTVTSTEGSPSFVGTISGTTSNPGGLTGASSYEATVNPQGAGSVKSIANGHFLQSGGSQVNITVDETISFDTRFSLPFPEKRTVDETGSLSGLTYTLVLHSVVSPLAVSVGGVVVPVDKLGLLAPYIGLASTITVAAAATAVCVRRVKHRKEKQ